MSIQLTVEAAEQLRKVIAEQNLSLSEMSLRVGFKGRATDRQYTLDLDENTRPDDRRFESNGVTVVCRACARSTNCVINGYCVSCVGSMYSPCSWSMADSNDEFCWLLLKRLLESVARIVEVGCAESWPETPHVV